MKILAPFNKIEEIEPLIREGADQLYCGIVSLMPSNVRANTDIYNLRSLDELKKSASLINSRGKEIVLLLNNSLLDYRIGLEMFLTAKKLGITSFIISNPLLLSKLKKFSDESSFYLSCINGVLNSDHIKFYKQFGIKGLHLPRHLSIEEFIGLKKNFPELDISVFAFEGGYCTNVQAHCYFPTCTGTTCCKSYETLKLNNVPLSSQEFNKRILEPKYSCGICAVKKFYENGIDIQKIEGRELSTDEKVRRVKLVKSAIDKAKTKMDEKSFFDFCKNRFKEIYGMDCSFELCYY